MATLSSIEKKLDEAARDIAKALRNHSIMIMDEFINEYYDETPSGFPEKYKRTESFRLDSLQYTDIFSLGNGYGSVVYFDPSSYKYQGLDGEAILNWNLHGMHGGHYNGKDVFRSGTFFIGEEYRDVAASVLKQKGIPFK